MPFLVFVIEKRRMSDCTRTPEMSSVVNSNRNQEQSENESTEDLVPPYHNEVESFDNAEEYPDMELVVKGMAKPLQLHRKIIASASGCFKTMLRGQKDTRLKWLHDASKETDREALVKTLRFCYGETQSIGTKNGECCAMIAALTRLQVTCLDDVVATLINFAMDEAKRNVETGVELLKACTQYKECCGSNPLSLDKRLAAIVLTKDNMRAHYKDVVDNCLMVLPMEYLMIAEYGEPHTRWSEFCLRTKYLRVHSKELSMEEKDALVSKCDWSSLNSHELRELRLTDIIDKDELLEAHEKALEYCENENERKNEMLRVMQKEMEDKVNELEKAKEETERATEAERETEELRRLVERTEKEKDEKVKQVEKERDKCAKEAEEGMKRAVKAEKEKEEENARAIEAEPERDKLRAYAEQVEKEKQEMDEQLREAEKEREMRERELEEYKRRTEKAEEEKEKYKNNAEALDTFIRGICLYNIDFYCQYEFWFTLVLMQQIR